MRLVLSLSGWENQSSERLTNLTKTTQGARNRVRNRAREALWLQSSDVHKDLKWESECQARVWRKCAQVEKDNFQGGLFFLKLDITDDEIWTSSETDMIPMLVSRYWYSMTVMQEADTGRGGQRVHRPSQYISLQLPVNTFFKIRSFLKVGI